MDLTQDRLKYLLHYEPLTGDWVWIGKAKKARNIVGKKAGRLGPYGYWLIGVDLKRYPAHRLAFLYMEGVMPPHEIDHINGIRDDNRWENLRHATRKQNQENKMNHSMRGIRWDRGNWLVRIKTEGKTIYLARTPDLEEAKRIRREAEIAHFTHSPACNTQPGSP